MYTDSVANIDETRQSEGKKGERHKNRTCKTI